MIRQVIWWGRSNAGYSRNRSVRQLFAGLGWKINDFRPLVSSIADVEAQFRGLLAADLIWVPCFRQRDLGAALRFGRRLGIPVIADPLISAWDKQVFERRKFAASSTASERLRHWESNLLQACDAVIVDTTAHAQFFADNLGISPKKLHVLWVGAEQPLFAPRARATSTSTVEALFFGSFIGLHGVETVIEAARLANNARLRWVLLGSGPERTAAEHAGADLPNLSFEEPVPYTDLPARIALADVVLGVFGTSEKAGRVIPNKVFQGMACGKPVVTRSGSGYPRECLEADSGLVFVKPGDSKELSASVCDLAGKPALRTKLGGVAERTFNETFGRDATRRQLEAALKSVGLI